MLGISPLSMIRPVPRGPPRTSTHGAAINSPTRMVDAAASAAAFASALTPGASMNGGGGMNIDAALGGAATSRSTTVVSGLAVTGAATGGTKPGSLSTSPG